MLRYQVLLPICFNDGSVVPHHLHDHAIDQIVGKFGGASVDWDGMEGQWKDEHGKLHKEGMIDLFVDTPIGEWEATFQWFSERKKEWEHTFRQDVIYIVTYSILVVC